MTNRRGRRKARSMTAAEFEQIRPFLKERFSDERINAAFLGLVEDQTLEGIGTIYSQTRQAVSDSISKVWKVWEQYQEAQAATQRAKAPEGWEQVTLMVPKDLLPSFYAQIAAARGPGIEEEKPKPRKKKAALKSPDNT